MPAQRRTIPARSGMRVVSQATNVATASLDPDDIISASVEALVRFFELTRVDLWRMQDGRLVHAARAGAGPEVPPAPLLLFERLTRGRLAQCVDLSHLESEAELEWRKLLFSLGCGQLGVYTLATNGIALGCITVAHTEDGSGLIDELTLFCEQVATALDKARLHAQARRSARAVEMQNRVLRDLAECRRVKDLPALLDRHLDTVEPRACTAIAVFDPFGRAMVIEADEDGQAHEPRLATVDEQELFQLVAETSAVIELDLTGSGATACGLLGIEDPNEDVQAYAIALGPTERQTGVLFTAAPANDRSTALRDLVEAAAPAVTIGVENAVMFTRAQVRSDRLAHANDLARLVASANSSSDLFDRLANGVQQMFSATRVAVYDSQLQLASEGGTDAAGDASSEQQLVTAASRRRRTSCAEHRDHTSWAVPMVTRGNLLGVLYAEQPDSALATFDDGDRALLDGVAEHATATLGMIATRDELERNYLSTVQALASALEASDQYTHDHAQDVALWAVEVGRRLGLPERELKDLELAAIFHDIGKIAIPSEILNKPGKLTEAEFEIMKTHTLVGEKIIAPIEFLQRVCPMVRHEHERWDGRGYPDGIAGDDIPLGSRIIFVCDAYHAITSDRPYREAQSHEVARRVLIENAGSQFDPAVVSVFLDVIDPHIEATRAQGIATATPDSGNDSLDVEQATG